MAWLLRKAGALTEVMVEACCTGVQSRQALSAASSASGPANHQRHQPGAAPHLSLRSGGRRDRTRQVPAHSGCNLGSNLQQGLGLGFKVALRARGWAAAVAWRTTDRLCAANARAMLPHHGHSASCGRLDGRSCRPQSVVLPGLAVNSVLRQAAKDILEVTCTQGFVVSCRSDTTRNRSIEQRLYPRRIAVLQIVGAESDIAGQQYSPAAWLIIEVSACRQCEGFS